MLWFWLSLLAALIFSALPLMMRIFAVNSTDQRAFSFVFNCYASSFAIILYLIETRGVLTIPNNLSPFQILLIFFAAILYGLYERFNYKARKLVDASTFVILFQLNPVIAFVISVTLLGESYTPAKLTGMLLVVIASILAIYEKGHFKMGKQLFIPLLIIVFLAFANTIDKPASFGIPTGFYNVLVWVPAILIVFIPKISFAAIKIELKTGSWKVALAAILNVISYYIFIKALAIADASKVIPITSTSTVLVVLGGIFLLNERTNLGKKIFAGFLVFIGVLLLI
ncbi:MAG: DMT family transporter [Patescibacteria group bacterium]